MNLLFNMKKLIRHSWDKVSFGVNYCPKCKTTRQRITTGFYFYFNEYGRQLPWKPDCKSTFLNDKI